MPVAGGWGNVLTIFESEYITKLRDYSKCHVVMLIDFDGDVAQRRSRFDQVIPEDIKSRVFVLGPKHTPEVLKAQLNQGFEKIGTALAEDCAAETAALWGHPELDHNEPDRQRLVQAVRPFLF